MNDTKKTFRQKTILNLVNQSNGLSRQEIQNILSEQYEISKPTLIRDLNVLLADQLLLCDGAGRKTRYISTANHPLLTFFDLKSYFFQDPDNRLVKQKNFNPQVFKHLKNLFSSVELTDLAKITRSFRLATTNLSPNVLKKELERFVIELSWKSSKIEGNTYTLLQTETLIKENRPVAGKTQLETQMILNHKIAFETILANRSDFKKISISKVNQLHDLLTKDLKIDAGIRKYPVGVTGTVYRPLDNEHQLKNNFNQFCVLLNQLKNPFEKTLLVEAMLPYLQPYADGNKRTARMLANGILLAHDYYPLSYRSVDEEEFKQALILFYEQNSLLQLKKILIEQIIFAYKNYFL